MLSPVIRLALWLIAIWVVFSGLALNIGQHLPAPDAQVSVLGFDTCQLPCWAGITTGLTPSADAPSILAARFSTLDISLYSVTTGFSFEIDTTMPPLSGILFFQGDVISEVHLYLDLPMWYLIERLGTPTCVSMSKAGDHIGLNVFWENTDVSTGALVFFDNGSVWTPAMHTRYLQISTVSVCNLADMLPWLGFAHTWHYEAVAGRLD